MHANTYEYDAFTDSARREELERLQKQATAALAIEQQALVDVGIKEAGRILDIGCGPGFISTALARFCPQAMVTGLDSSEELLKEARTLVAADCSNINFKNGDAYRTGLPDDQFDFIYNRLLYQHLDNPLQALQEAKRVATKGGRICIMDVDDDLQIIDPDLESFSALKAEACANQQAGGGDRRIGRKLARLMDQAGLTDIRVHMNSVSSLDIGWDAFFNITTRFKALQIPGERGQALLTQLEEEIAALPQPPFGIAGVITAVGKK